MSFNASDTVTTTGKSDNDQSEEPEATLKAQEHTLDGSANQECCLVQIYPADVVDGMLLLEEDLVILGRDANCEIVLPDHSVSRQHAELAQENGCFNIRDLGSTNGTSVNGQPIESHRLCSGDTIRIGSFMFKYLAAGSVESQYHETVYSALTRDALTGTMNKRYLLESLQRGIASATRQRHVVSVLMLDIDHFKSVNDTYGHLVGDEVLREFGKRVSCVCREEDLLARYGGEEFCLMLALTDREEALEMAERCRSVIASEPFVTAAGPIEITASFGLACTDPSEPATPNQIIEQADQKLYEAKRAGRNRVCG